ncbi:uncharacterized protein MELLADRAFT_89727 [Melampsora larici-populina 98AG31]|uniref:Uncharacterized protein n=1 Tax=Melampsora larici-populina (strain 98AG31 / pathotype 3-4-7) TaxID=747676 RepID=F4RUE3_MELLP|nr:uncharacterized protein MELLADRAFT_89727 [Melampsora larici-populina 98AG31]EGG03918.1 hypothetical protein MELLADRAFT_89727 [Melampsora larici-populina 98AG31]
MSKPYTPSNRAKKKPQNHSPDNETESLVNSLPESLRFLKPGASRLSHKSKEVKAQENQGQDEDEDLFENEVDDGNNNQLPNKDQQVDDDEDEELQKEFDDEDKENQQEDDNNDTHREGHDDDETSSTNPPDPHSTSPSQHQGGSTNRVQELFRTADPSVPSVRRLMAPNDREKFEKVADIFGLDSRYRAEALRLGSITGDDNRYWTLLCLQQLQRQELAKEAANSCAEWIPKPNFAEQLKKLMRRTLRDSFIKSYTETLDQNKVIISGSFHRKAMQAIMDNTKAWKAEYLPSDFGTTLEDLSNHDKFMELFRSKLRHARDDFPLILLKEIVVPQRKIDLKEPQTEVPALGALLGHLYHFFDPNESRTMTELLKAVNTKTQARFAYLRMALAVFHNTSAEKRKAQGGLTNWRMIDHNLSEFRDKSRDYRRAFNAIVLARDQGLFNGKNTWDEIKSNAQFEVPSVTDVVTTIPFLPTNAS